MIFSSFGTKLTGDCGILQLMDDLGRPLPAGVNPCMLGGGNPARIPGVEAVYRREMEALLANGDAFEEAISRYDAPQGRIRFIEALVNFFRKEYGWNISEENIAITNGSQTAFFYLFNLFSGTTPERKTILFPLVPEYVGYADQGIEKDTFVTLPARMIDHDAHTFKYHIDIPLVTEYLSTHPEVGAICVSRPTNPTGNVLTDVEIAALASLCAQYAIPLMIDNAYGMPFPDIIFPDMLEGTPVPYWDNHTILSMSLSKIGLPALRTGIIIAEKQIITALSALNSIAALASGSLGQILAEGIVRSGEIKTLASKIVQPFYREKSLFAQECIKDAFFGRPWKIHRSEGAIFLWLQIPDLSISSLELYKRLKERGVIIVPGEYFFFGRDSGSEIEQAWKNHPHRENCLRLNYSRGKEEIVEGIKIISEISQKFRK
ncbi:MAG TPA: valine--pyruvate transaminase [Treponemataceae bacterium]|nr:valine--pyruvate transaminase [Treponemataceae bacterium]